MSTWFLDSQLVIRNIIIMQCLSNKVMINVVVVKTVM